MEDKATCVAPSLHSSFPIGMGMGILFDNRVDEPVDEIDKTLAYITRRIVLQRSATT